LLVLLMLSLPAHGSEGWAPGDTGEALDGDVEALALGRQVLAVRRALQDPTAPGALEALRALGTDSRYYVMVRGWLAQQLQGDLSILEASGGEVSAEVTARVDLLRRAIRAIDLE
jgi:hypothetical protein